MSQPPGRGSDRNHRKENNDMALTYTGGYPAPGSQTLPSFRELLPEHLHKEIDQAAYYSSQSQSTDRHRTPDPSSYNKSISPLPYPHSSSTTGSSGRGRPNQLLPPLRNLQSSSRHHRGRPMSSYDDASSRSGSSSGRGYISSRGSTEDDRRYRSASGTAMYDNQNAYDPARYAAQQPYMGSSYPSSNHSGQSADYDYPSPMSGHSHTLPASSTSFGAMGGGGGGANDLLDSRGKRRRGNLPKNVTDVLRAWFHEHLDHPYPTEEDKQRFMNETNLTMSQISNWFINARRRQLPALRNQLRNSDGEHLSRGHSPMSDVEASMSPPHSRH
ncbi:homeobox transcription factor, putative [Talaromyces stipitatus ATCC 10500]|uniref:Homeobox transcription factor, putative n=1 Tax=Talaromyces stipitatus (strain ATCC 10500 / CBS 375.48 / QM 6759 / NRRL 1006) TaxID=441959 RepID=B8MKW2_TALSN|nr:homeobox transcription factor, putative [Talaromyces stipitatus ATCC 10500]EED14961.1 homeobox transcription factor, putative [Talaromyces stipitatus ATCC 10500]